MSDTTKPPDPKPDRVKPDRWSTYITLPNGTRIYAKTYGKKAFPIFGPANDNETKKAV